MGYVFIRYVKQDKQFITQLIADLRQAGVEIWQGVQAIAPGEDWETAMEHAIAESESLLFVSSRFSSQSQLISNQIDFAIEQGIPVLPIVIDFPGFKYMPKQLYGIDWLDFRKDYAKTLRNLIDRIPDTARYSEPTAPKDAQSRGYVFLSYAQEDTDFVIKLREFLQVRGYSYWDYQESERDYHNQLFLELEDVIKEASATLSVLSPDWKRSPWCPKEYLFSEQVLTPVFLLHARPMEPTLITMGVPYIDFVEGEYRGFEKLETELKRKGLL